mmetsp:Transcript_28399/g.62433  ORF Transcript_28399/g.62433 Transcript_28399/m.62433 type:complete len:268 (+) Transcript_28399:765-1568(+)
MGLSLEECNAFIRCKIASAWLPASLAPALLIALMTALNVITVGRTLSFPASYSCSISSSRDTAFSPESSLPERAYASIRAVHVTAFAFLVVALSIFSARWGPSPVVSDLDSASIADVRATVSSCPGRSPNSFPMSSNITSALRAPSASPLLAQASITVEYITAFGLRSRLPPALDNSIIRYSISSARSAAPTRFDRLQVLMTEAKLTLSGHTSRSPASFISCIACSTSSARRGASDAAELLKAFSIELNDTVSGRQDVSILDRNVIR